MSHILVFDVGTSSVKAVLFTADGRIFAEAETPYKTSSAADGRQEQAPSDWIEATTGAIRQIAVNAGAVELIVLSGTMQSVIPVDGAGVPIRTAILYSDGRAKAELAELSAVFGPLADTIGNVPDEFMSVFKIAWMRRHEPALFERTATFHSGAKDFVAHWMTGRATIDPTAASTVGLMNFLPATWNATLLRSVGLDEHRLPQIVAGDEIVGGLLPEVAARLGLRSGTPVMNGSGDAGASTLGAAIEGPGATYVYVGTTAWAAQQRQKADAAADRSASIYALAHPNDPSLSIRIGAMLSGGDSAAWISEVLSRSLPELDAMLSDPAFRPSSAVFLPYLKGERCPFLDSSVRAGFLRLSRSDGTAQLHHAVIEGICLAIRTNVDALGDVASDVLLLGGGALSTHLPQILADCLNRPVAVAAAPSSVTALGCFRMGAKTLGWADVRPAVTRRVEPRAGSGRRVAARLDLFRRATEFVRQLPATP